MSVSLSEVGVAYESVRRRGLIVSSTEGGMVSVFSSEGVSIYPE